MSTEQALSALFGIAGKRALVTGATSGIGRRIAEGLASVGAEVWLVARDGATLEAAVASLGPGKAHGIVADVAIDAGIATIAAGLSDRPLHILVNNAGTNRDTPLDPVPDNDTVREDFEAVVGLNLTAPFLVTRALLPNLERAASADDPARVIAISSIAALSPGPLENFAYSASKSGLAMMTRHLAGRLAGRHIACNAIAPGLFPSRMSEQFIGLPESGGAPPRGWASPLGQRVGTGEDIAGTVIYLSSRAGAWVTGVLLPVSGGVATVS